MGLFDGVSLKSIVRDVTNVVGAFTGAAPIQDKQPTTVIEAPQTSPGWIPGQSPIENLYDQRTDYFGRVLPGIFSTLPGFNQTQPATEINISIPSETKESGQMENGPQVYQGAAGALVPFAQQLGRTIFGGGVGSAIGGAVGGAVIGQGVQQFMGGDACGCGPKPFVRLDKCGRPIITRAMQAKAKDMVMCMGIEGAAAALGVSVPLLAEIAFKRFKPRAKGISGAQLKTAQRVNNKIMHMAKKLEASCKRSAARRR
jgi:hypothetical protein